MMQPAPKPATTAHRPAPRGLERPAEIKLLVRTLGRDGALAEDVFAANAYRYVQENVQTEFRYGLSKGGFGALLDRSGTPFDQAHLLVALFRERGLTAGYQLGTITLSGAQFAAWSGISRAAAACRLLADGGIPAIINGTTRPACDYAGDVTTVTLGHVWVEAAGKLYDPAFKPHLPVAGIDLAAVLGCGTQQAPTCGSTAVAAAIRPGPDFQGNDGVADYVRNVDTAALGGILTGYATNLQHHIETHLPAAQLEDVIGGRRLDQNALPAAAAALPYPASVTARWSGDIPDPYRSRFRSRFDGIDIWLYGDETYGYWLHVGGHKRSPGLPTTRDSYLIFEREAGTSAPVTLDIEDHSAEVQGIAREPAATATTRVTWFADGALDMLTDPLNPGTKARAANPNPDFGRDAPADYRGPVPWFCSQRGSEFGRGRRLRRTPRFAMHARKRKRAEIGKSGGHGMTDITDYHIPAFLSSRNTLAMIRNCGVDPKIIGCRHTPPSHDTSANLIARLGMSVHNVVREKGTHSAELGWVDPSLSDDALPTAMMAHPILINRPIVATPLGVRQCRPSAHLLDRQPDPQRAAFANDDIEAVGDAAGSRRR